MFYGSRYSDKTGVMVYKPSQIISSGGSQTMGFWVIFFQGNDCDPAFSVEKITRVMMNKEQLLMNLKLTNYDNIYSYLKNCDTILLCYSLKLLLGFWTCWIWGTLQPEPLSPWSWFRHWRSVSSGLKPLENSTARLRYFPGSKWIVKD